MIDSTTLFGLPRLRILAADLVTVLYTLYLPVPDRDGGVDVQDTWAKGTKTMLLGGGMRFIPGGIRHNVTLTWAIYDPTNTRRTIGVTDGCTPELTDLYDQLATYNTGRLVISPCSNKEIWWRVACTSDLNRKPVDLLNRDVSLTLEGMDVYATASSTVVIA